MTRSIAECGLILVIFISILRLLLHLLPLFFCSDKKEKEKRHFFLSEIDIEWQQYQHYNSGLIMES
jgi:hypothetical protein